MLHFETRLFALVMACALLVGCQDLLGISVPVDESIGQTADAAVGVDAAVVDIDAAADIDAGDPVELCTDGMDNDGDAQADCRDPDCSGDAACAGRSLLISEVVDHADIGIIKYVEIYNATGAPMSLSGWQIRRHSNTGNQGDVDLPDVILQPGATFLAVSMADPFMTAFGVTADIENNVVINGNGDDSYELLDGGALVDVYGDPSADPKTPQPWYYQDSVAKRSAGIMQGSPIWLFPEWTISPGATEANPGDRN